MVRPAGRRGPRRVLAVPKDHHGPIMTGDAMSNALPNRPLRPVMLPTQAGAASAGVRRSVDLPLRIPDGFATVARAFSFEGLADGKEHLRWRSATGRRRCERAAAGGARTAGAPAQRVPHRRRVRQRALRLRPAAPRGGGADHRRRRVPALPPPGGPRHRALHQARRVRAAGRAASTPTRRTWRWAAARTSGTTRRRRRCSARWASSGSGCSATTPTRPRSSRAGRRVTEQVPTGAHVSPSNLRYLRAKAAHSAHTLQLPPEPDGA